MQNSCLKTSAWWSRGSHCVENGYLSLRFPNMVNWIFTSIERELHVPYEFLVQENCINKIVAQSIWHHGPDVATRDWRELLLMTSLIYIACIRSILEYSSPVFHRTLPSYLSQDLERLQKCAMKIIYPELLYAKVLELCRLLTHF